MQPKILDYTPILGPAKAYARDSRLKETSQYKEFKDFLATLDNKAAKRKTLK